MGVRGLGLEVREVGYLSVGASRMPRRDFGGTESDNERVVNVQCLEYDSFEVPHRRALSRKVHLQVGQSLPPPRDRRMDGVEYGNRVSFRSMEAFQRWMLPIRSGVGRQAIRGDSAN